MTQDPRPGEPDNKPDQNSAESLPPAGPHAREDLIDNEKTPGTGALPDKDGGEADVGSD